MQKTQISILIIGSGGREHALAWKIKQSPLAGKIYVAPGNAGTAQIAENVSISADNIPELLAFAQANNIGLTVVGPEVPLSLGVVDTFQAAGFTIFGPSKAAAQLEASKAFSKQFMQANGIKTAAFGTFTEQQAALDYLESLPVSGVVVKASGLAAGKGVIVCDNKQQARTAIHTIMSEQQFGAAGDELIIEARLSGDEVSLLAFSDGKTVVPMIPARDHKRVFNNDEGPNTGGMGAYAPPPDVDGCFVANITETVLQPTVDGMAKAGIPYVGVLYAGLMVDGDDVNVLEFNCRFGDPETQVVLPMLDGDLVAIMQKCIAGSLTPEDVKITPGACAAVVMASPGYPSSYPKGLPISGLDTDSLVFHAGTKQIDGQVVTASGRVLAVSATGVDLADALGKAYAGVETITFDGAHFRTDIGRKYTN